MGKRKKKNQHYAQFASQATSTVASSTAISKSQPSVQVDRNTAVYTAHQEEYKYISKDLIRVAVINILFFAAVITVYFINKNNPFLENWASKLF